MVTKPPRKNNLNLAAQPSAQGYRFIDKDPDMEVVVAAIANSGLTVEAISEMTERQGNKVSAAAMVGWMYGKTKRPQNYTLTAVMQALGYNRKWMEANMAPTVSIAVATAAVDNMVSKFKLKGGLPPRGQKGKTAKKALKGKTAKSGKPKALEATS
jgi:hypothetical protein